MKLFLLAAAAASLALGACSDGGPSPVAPASPLFASGDKWTIFANQTPASILDASPGWEVGTRFYTTVGGCITRFRFYRASGETGTNTIKLWTNTGTLLWSHTFNLPKTGWNYVELRDHGVGPYVDLSYCDIVKGAYYRVSVNTNTKQVKTFGFFNSAVVNGPLIADAGFYGQPTGSMPTQHSSSGFFVDVTFTEN